MLHDVGCSKNCEGFFFISIALTVSAIIEQNSVYMTIVYNSSELGEKLNNVSNLHLEAGKWTLSANMTLVSYTGLQMAFDNKRKQCDYVQNENLLDEIEINRKYKERSSHFLK